MTANLIHLDGRPVIIGGGLAGLMTALSLVPEPVILISKAPLGEEASSRWAQGGLAAAIGAGARIRAAFHPMLDIAGKSTSVIVLALDALPGPAAEAALRENLAASFAQGRDAADVPIVHIFGPGELVSFRVWTDELA